MYRGMYGYKTTVLRNVHMFYELFNYYYADIKSVNSLYVIFTHKYFYIKESTTIYDYKPVHNILLYRPPIAKTSHIISLNVADKGEKKVNTWMDS